MPKAHAARCARNDGRLRSFNFCIHSFFRSMFCLLTLVSSMFVLNECGGAYPFQTRHQR